MGISGPGHTWRVHDASQFIEITFPKRFQASPASSQKTIDHQIGSTQFQALGLVNQVAARHGWSTPSPVQGVDRPIRATPG